MARAAAKVLDASVALIDRSSAVLAVAGASSDQEQKLLSGGEGVTAVELRVADSVVGELRYRGRSAPDPAIARMVTTLLALELERSRSPEWESEEVAGAFVAAVLARKVTDRGDIVARASELGADLERGAGVLILRVAPRAAQTGEWRARVMTLAMRALRSLAPGSLATAEDGEVAAEIAVIVPAEDDERLARAAARAGAGARGQPLRLPPDDRPQPPRRRPGRPLPLRQRGAAGGQRRRGRGPARCSPSRTPAPTACCCRR